MQVGNGVMNIDTDNIGRITYPWTHGLISDETYKGLIDSCTQSNVDGNLCSDFEEKASNEKGNIYGYDIYAPLCGASKLTEVCK